MHYAIWPFWQHHHYTVLQCQRSYFSLSGVDCHRCQNEPLSDTHSRTLSHLSRCWTSLSRHSIPQNMQSRLYSNAPLSTDCTCNLVTLIHSPPAFCFCAFRNQSSFCLMCMYSSNHGDTQLLQCHHGSQVTLLRDCSCTEISLSSWTLADDNRFSIPPLLNDFYSPTMIYKDNTSFRMSHSLQLLYLKTEHNSFWANVKTHDFKWVW